MAYINDHEISDMLFTHFEHMTKDLELQSGKLERPNIYFEIENPKKATAKSMVRINQSKIL